MANKSEHKQERRQAQAQPEETASRQPEQESPQPEATQEQTPQPEAAQAGAARQEAPDAARLSAEQEKAARLAQQLEQMKDQMLRTAAEFDNFRKRSQKEKDAAFGDGLAHAVGLLLPVLDALEMAEAAQTADENYKKGVSMTLQQAQEAFKKLEVAEIDALGKEFDPNLMNAVMQQPTPEGGKAGIVLQVLQKGYTRGGKVIRHAVVAVSQ